MHLQNKGPILFQLEIFLELLLPFFLHVNEVPSELSVALLYNPLLLPPTARFYNIFRLNYTGFLNNTSMPFLFGITFAFIRIYNLYNRAAVE